MVENLLYKWAREWFGKYHPEATLIDEYTGPVQPHGFIGRTDSGQHVTFVSMAALSDFAKRGTIKPLLVVSYRDKFTAQQYELLSQRMSVLCELTGWSVVAVDAMDEAKVQGFGVALPTLDTLSIDSIIELLEALKRVREAGGEADGV